jgi:hypothetical protein
MEYFSGLDVSLEETAICIVDENGPDLGGGPCYKRTGSVR